MRNTLMPLLMMILFLIVCVSWINNHAKYQVAGCGNGNAMVLDIYTGEAWITDEYDSSDYKPTKIKYLKPVGYCDSQKPEWNYTPEEKRNNRNSTWWTWFKRNLYFS